MSLLCSLRRPQLLLNVCRSTKRCYASQNKPVQAQHVTSTPQGQTPPSPATSEPLKVVSSCPEGTVLQGLNYLKNQPPVVALADDAYPPWLWKLLEPKVIPDDGPGGVGEKLRLKKERRQRIREQNFMKTQ